MIYNVRDKLSGADTRFAGNTTVSIIGGGQTVDQIREYSEKDREVYRNDKPVFGALTRADNEGSKRLAPMNSSELFIEWICAVGSPCEASDRWSAYVQQGTAPQYFFLMQVTTLPDESSYCKLEHKFIVRLVNLEIKQTDVIIVLAATVMFLFTLMLIGYNFYDPRAMGDMAWMVGEDTS